MRISDWSSDVCSSDHMDQSGAFGDRNELRRRQQLSAFTKHAHQHLVMIDDAVADAHDRLEHQPKAAALEGVADARAPQCSGALVFEFGIVGMKNVYQIAATLARPLSGAPPPGKQQKVFTGEIGKPRG